MDLERVELPFHEDVLQHTGVRLDYVVVQVTELVQYRKVFELRTQSFKEGSRPLLGLVLTIHCEILFSLLYQILVLQSERLRLCYTISSAVN